MHVTAKFHTFNRSEGIVLKNKQMKMPLKNIHLASLRYTGDHVTATKDIR